jgi:hypothetical protein
MEFSNTDTDYYTPESIAWKIYQDDDDKPLSSQILGFGPEGESDYLLYKYEMLLSIFLEMLIHIMKMDILEVNSDINEDDDIEPSFEEFDMDHYYPIIKNKFKKISYLVSVNTYDNFDDKEYLLEIIKNRYSRIILRNNPEDTHYFDQIHSIDYYDFIPSEGYKQQNKLKNIFSILILNKKVYTFYFDSIIL